MTRVCSREECRTPCSSHPHSPATPSPIAEPLPRRKALSNVQELAGVQQRPANAVQPVFFDKLRRRLQFFGARRSTEGETVGECNLSITVSADGPHHTQG